MNRKMRRDADEIISFSLQAVLPDEAIRRALKDFQPGRGKVLLVAAGKAAWQMARAAEEVLDSLDGGIVVTKYGHVKGEIPGVLCCEAGHPVPDENGFSATAKALELVKEHANYAAECGYTLCCFFSPAAAVPSSNGP